MKLRNPRVPRREHLPETPPAGLPHRARAQSLRQRVHPAPPRPEVVARMPGTLAFYAPAQPALESVAVVVHEPRRQRAPHQPLTLRSRPDPHPDPIPDPPPHTPPRPPRPRPHPRPSPRHRLAPHGRPRRDRAEAFFSRVIPPASQCGHAPVVGRTPYPKPDARDLTHPSSASVYPVAGRPSGPSRNRRPRA